MASGGEQQIAHFETHHVDWFAGVVLLMAVLLVIFLVMISIYSYNLGKGKIPGKTESTAIFWTSIILIVLLLVVGGLALWKLFRRQKVLVPVQQSGDGADSIPLVAVRTAPASKGGISNPADIASREQKDELRRTLRQDR